MKNLMMALILVGCVSDPQSNDASDPSMTDSGGCRLGEQPVFGDDGRLVCAGVPEWPPQSAGARSVPARCDLRDGDYLAAWQTDHETLVRPGFAYDKHLVVVGDVMLEPEPPYQILTFNLDWVDSGTANVWTDGDTDTWEFVIWADCETGALRGTRTINLPYYNPGHQVETWTLTAVRSPP